MEMINEMELSPKEYFDQIKDKKNTITNKQLNKVYENCLELANKYYATGQVRGLRKILFCMESIEKEKKLLDLGISTFIYRDDIDFYIDEVARKRPDYQTRPVKSIDLERYEREIPDEVVDIIMKTKISLIGCMLYIPTILGKRNVRSRPSRRKRIRSYLVSFWILKTRYAWTGFIIWQIGRTSTVT